MGNASGKALWVGRVISVLVSLLFLLSAFLKLKGGPDLALMLSGLDANA